MGLRDLLSGGGFPKKNRQFKSAGEAAEALARRNAGFAAGSVSPSDRGAQVAQGMRNIASVTGDTLSTGKEEPAELNKTEARFLDEQPGMGARIRSTRASRIEAIYNARKANKGRLKY